MKFGGRFRDSVSKSVPPRVRQERMSIISVPRTSNRPGIIDSIRGWHNRLASKYMIVHDCGTRVLKSAVFATILPHTRLVRNLESMKGTSRERPTHSLRDPGLVENGARERNDGSVVQEKAFRIRTLLGETGMLITHRKVSGELLPPVRDTS